MVHSGFALLQRTSAEGPPRTFCHPPLTTFCSFLAFWPLFDTEYRCILNYYPINSETILWGNSEIAPLEINSLTIRFFGVIFLPPKTLVDPHNVVQNYPA